MSAAVVKVAMGALVVAGNVVAVWWAWRAVSSLLAVLGGAS